MPTTSSLAPRKKKLTDVHEPGWKRLKILAAIRDVTLGEMLDKLIAAEVGRAEASGELPPAAN